MFGYIIKTIILTIFAIIIIHFIIEHTKNIWYIPKYKNYDASYKKIVELLDSLPDIDYPPEPSNPPEPSKSIKPIEYNNSNDSNNPMEIELTEYITNMT